ncbi:MAG: hypothetical protein ACRECA_11590 [Pseudolabrys sp.]
MPEDKAADKATADNTTAGSEPKNEGEGNWTAARAYDRDQKRFAESGKVEPAARRAVESLERDKDELRSAEEEGKRHSHGEDPAVKR